MKKKIVLIVLFSLVIIGLGYAIYSLNNKNKQKSKIIADMEFASSQAGLRHRQLQKTKDSLALINSFLAKYRILTEAMTYRDSIRLPMKYNVGDIIHLKRDSSRAIISDIVVGGSKHTYYIKYKVMYKNGEEEDILPELIY